MGNTSPAAQILRKDLLAQLRAAGCSLTTLQLRGQASRVPVPGAAVALPPLREQVYRVLRALQRDGLVTRGRAFATVGDGGQVAWSAAPSPADGEIAALEAAFRATATHRDQLSH